MCNGHIMICSLFPLLYSILLRKLIYSNCKNHNLSILKVSEWLLAWCNWNDCCRSYESLRIILYYFLISKLKKMILYFSGTPHRLLLSSWSPFSLFEVLGSLARPLTFYQALTHLRPPSLVQPILSSMFFISRFIIDFIVQGLIQTAYVPAVCSKHAFLENEKVSINFDTMSVCLDVIMP